MFARGLVGLWTLHQGQERDLLYWMLFCVHTPLTLPIFAVSIGLFASVFFSYLVNSFFSPVQSLFQLVPFSKALHFFTAGSSSAIPPVPGGCVSLLLLVFPPPWGGSPRLLLLHLLPASPVPDVTIALAPEEGRTAPQLCFSTNLCRSAKLHSLWDKNACMYQH